MRTRTPQLATAAGILTLAALIVGTSDRSVFAQGAVPGTGTKLAGEDFEDPEWKFEVNWPKSSYNLNRWVNEPLGVSSNGIFHESSKRGIPEIMKRVKPPEGGMSGSTGALRMQTLYAGIPGQPSYKTQQDDALMDLDSQLSGAIPVSWYPSSIVRVYMPPFEQWDPHSGTSLGMRVQVTGVGPDELEEGEKPKKRSKSWFRKRRKNGPERVRDSFYPSFFIQFNSKADGNEKDSAVFVIRGNDQNQDYVAKEINQTGWWTLGISFSPEGRAHYYASPGTDPLTQKDHIVSHFPQSVRVEYLQSMFFSICNQDTGKHWSTEWIIDDPSIYAARTYHEARR